MRKNLPTSTDLFRTSNTMFNRIFGFVWVWLGFGFVFTLLVWGLSIVGIICLLRILEKASNPS